MPDFLFDEAENLDNLGGPATKYRKNIAVLRLLRQLETEAREATAEEQRVLCEYVGWGDSNIIKLAFPQGTYSWTQPAEEIEELLSEDEIRLLRSSSLTAFYTTLPVIRGIYEGLDQLGLQYLPRLRVLEPAAGVGHFLGAMPPSLRGKADCAAVEIDSVSARIARKLYPTAKVYEQGFEDTALPQNYFDLAISNIPFCDVRVVDTSVKQNYLKARLHDYFFVKTIRVVRPGGIIAFITSRGTLDKKDERVRPFIAEHAEFMAALRLSKTAFKQNAGTDVVADLLVLRKRQRPDAAAPDREAWVKVAALTVPKNRGGRTESEINSIFVADPTLMLGIPIVENGMYGGSEQFSVRGDKRDLRQAISETLKRTLPTNIFSQQIQSSAIGPTPELFSSSSSATDGEEESEVKNRLFTTSARESVKASALLDLYFAAKTVIKTQLIDASDEQVAEAQAELSSLYDRFRMRFGYINSKHNLKAFRKDNPLLSFVRALEETSPRGGFQKAAIFNTRTVRPHKRPTHADSPKEALLLCLNEKGRVDMEYIAELSRTSVQDAENGLKGLVFHTPDGLWLTADEYLSGNVRARLRDAEAATELDPSFAENVEALKNVQPKLLGPGEIIARLGAGWIPADIIQDFAKELVPEYDGKIDYVEPLATWTVEAPGYMAKTSHASIQKWGTRRANAFELLEDALNLRRTAIYDVVGTGEDKTRALNQVETVAAVAKLSEIKEKFQEWVWDDPDQEKRLCEIYNDRFNTMRERRYDGSHLTLPGASVKITLRDHQKDAIWRVLQRSTLLGHCVGSGKTMIGIASVHEMRRIGIARKPMVVVPKIAVTQWADEAQRLYPGIRLLTTDVKDFANERRGETMSRIATGDWDLIVVPHPSFKLLPVATATFNGFVQEEIDRLRDYLADLEDEKSKHRRTIKQLEKAARKLEAKIKGNESVIRRDNEHTVTWEELGVDALFVDEAHEFKNLFFASKMLRISGLPNSESQRAFDMFMKIRLLFEQGGRVVFLTGTPVSNTLAEVYTMMRYLQLDMLKELGVDQFDAWAQNFSETSTGLEMKPDGSGFRQHTRFNKFVNLPELSAMWRQYLDVRTKEQLQLPTPEIAGGEPIIVSVEASPDQKAYVSALARRAEDIRSGSVKPNVDNMLKVTTDGRKAALDMSLIDPTLPEHPDCKINALVERVVCYYERTHANKGTQLIFADLSTPKGRSGSKDRAKEAEAA
jgi:N12 class adenine-specific DNA methylase